MCTQTPFEFAHPPAPEWSCIHTIISTHTKKKKKKEKDEEHNFCVVMAFIFRYNMHIFLHEIIKESSLLKA